MRRYAETAPLQSANPVTWEPARGDELTCRTVSVRFTCAIARFDGGTHAAGEVIELPAALAAACIGDGIAERVDA